MKKENNKIKRCILVYLKKEMIEHQIIISSHHKEMQTLRDSLTLAMNRFDSLYEHADQGLKDMVLYFNQQILSLKNKVLANEVHISDQRKTILSLYQQLHDFHLDYPNRMEIDKIKKDIDSQIKEATTSHLSSFQNLQQELKSLFFTLQKDLSKLRLDLEEKFFEINEKMENKRCN